MNATGYNCQFDALDYITSLREREQQLEFMLRGTVEFLRWDVDNDTARQLVKAADAILTPKETK